MDSHRLVDEQLIFDHLANLLGGIGKGNFICPARPFIAIAED